MAAFVSSVAVLVTALGTLPIVRQTRITINQVNKAVNGKEPGNKTMVQQVQDLTDQAFPKSAPNTQGGIPTLVRIETLLQQLIEGQK